jgi:hypothetical protein
LKRTVVEGNAAVRNTFFRGRKETAGKMAAWRVASGGVVTRRCSGEI